MEDLKTHEHKCPNDGTVWRHTDTEGGNEEAHSCPKCKTVVWERHQEKERMAKVSDTLFEMLCDFFKNYGVDEKNGLAMLHKVTRELAWAIIDDREERLDRVKEMVDGLRGAMNQAGMNVGVAKVNILTGEVETIIGDAPNPSVVSRVVSESRKELGEHLEKVLGIKPGKA